MRGKGGQNTHFINLTFTFVVMSRLQYILSFRKQIFTILSVLLIGFSVLYGYFLQQTVSAVVERGRMSQEITQLRSDIGDAEQRFGAEIGSATRERARELGFRSTQDARYVSRSLSANTLVTLNVTGN